MRLLLKIIGLLLIFALLTSCVTATENKELPTKDEITNFIAGIPVSDNYIITVFNTVKDKQPAWNCDIWVDKNGNQLLSLYYVDPGSANGYDSTYFNELGKEISMRGVEAELVESYVGKTTSEENPPVETTPESIQEQSITAQEQRVTVQEQPVTIEEQHVTVQEQQVTVQEQHVTVQEQPAENEEQPAENEEQPAEDEETIWDDEIFSGIFIGVAVAFIACVLRLNH